MIKSWRKVKNKWCQACEMRKATEVHHVIARCDGGTNDETNLIDLCHDCHYHAPNGYNEITQYCLTKGWAVNLLITVRETVLELGIPMDDKQMEKMMLKVFRKVRNDARSLLK
jgi:hypothetical protein